MKPWKLSSDRLLLVAIAFALPALGLMALSIFVPRPAPVMLAMSVAQGLGGLSFLLYVVVIVRTMRSTEAPPQQKPNSD